VARVSASKEGEYWISVVINDGKNSVTSDPLVLKFTPGNRPPVIEGKHAYTCLVNEWVPMEVQVSDPDGDKFEITWTVEDPPMGRAAGIFASTPLPIPTQPSRHVPA